MTTNWDESVEAKYRVFKLEDWDRWQMEYKPPATPFPLEDAVVIRLKDPFATTALYTYANTILSYLELTPDLDPEVHQRMMEIADYFHQQATISQEIKNRRLPD